MPRRQSIPTFEIRIVERHALFAVADGLLVVAQLQVGGRTIVQVHCGGGVRFHGFVVMQHRCFVVLCSETIVPVVLGLQSAGQTFLVGFGHDHFRQVVVRVAGGTVVGVAGGGKVIVGIVLFLVVFLKLFATSGRSVVVFELVHGRLAFDALGRSGSGVGVGSVHVDESVVRRGAGGGR